MQQNEKQTYQEAYEPHIAKFGKMKKESNAGIFKRHECGQW